MNAVNSAASPAATSHESSERRQVLRHDLLAALANVRAFHALALEAVSESGEQENTDALADLEACLNLLGKAIQKTERVVDTTVIFLTDPDVEHRDPESSDESRPSCRKND